MPKNGAETPRTTRRSDAARDARAGCLGGSNDPLLLDGFLDSPEYRGYKPRDFIFCGEERAWGSGFRGILFGSEFFWPSL